MNKKMLLGLCGLVVFLTTSLVWSDPVKKGTKKSATGEMLVDEDCDCKVSSKIKKASPPEDGSVPPPNPDAPVATKAD
jgi:hypothetical protein